MASVPYFSMMSTGSMPLPLDLRHPLALAVLDVGVDEAVGERHVPQVVEPHHQHPGHPEGDDVPGGDQAGARVVVGQGVRAAVAGGQRGLPLVDLRRLRVGPAQGGVGPERRRTRCRAHPGPGPGRRPRAPRRASPPPLSSGQTISSKGPGPSRLSAAAAGSDAPSGRPMRTSSPSSPAGIALMAARRPSASSKAASQTGMRWPHQSWRLMHQSRFSESQLR